MEAINGHGPAGKQPLFFEIGGVCWRAAPSGSS
jgi:hypothetical protein